MNDIKPFRIEIPQSQLDDLHARLDLTRWPDELPGVGWSYGASLAYVKELVEYWRHSYDWRVHERRLNSFPQYTTEIDGQNVHFLHVRSTNPDALPLIITHGWPGSVVEFDKLIEPLADHFHLVIPSIPGFGFSGPTTDTGWTVERVARAWAELMRRLGYDRYGVQGGDWGSGISLALGRIAPEHVVGMHVNMLPTFPSGDPAELAELSDEEKGLLGGYQRFNDELSGYMKVQSTRPQTLAFGLHDSPVGQLAWIVDPFRLWTDSENVPEDAVDRDQMLTNIMVYWLTGTAASSARMYYENSRWENIQEPLNVPLGVAVFAHELAQPIRTLAEKSYNIIHWSEFGHGGHFAAMEAPEELVTDIRRFFSDM
ncbi:epoxide hydrolase family protein [Streptomyces turgidiscabies]|uniref:Hydrolase, alpha/beta domain protein n=1 Tax=Streptomyces turgidiscabies (strain Car8) TaxID=698760 RepID=L7EXA6_STRT8|nr:MULTISPECIES: epoxide hydrolase [Streptomyces]ELP63020.1 hydrolase, alpha/beta domain protein [Streptomyces turgidiscabies Car8]MDX3496589.1 epoxide hydrolase [Streptomyces turgidiscabies]GAQ72784.1 soluble epoxide hydrolase [Streptomyces turgidiscabies]